MKDADMFAAEASPELTLLDLEGRRHPVAGLSLVAKAIECANKLYGIGGMSSFRDDEEVEGDMADPDCGVSLLYYRSATGRPTKRELSFAAKVLSRSEVVLPQGGGKVTGRRAVVFPDRGVRKAEVTPFVISTKVWFNRNRSTANFPAYPVERDLLLDDINRRLECAGTVSFPKP